MAEHKPSRQEVRDLLAVAERDLGDCQTKGLSADWRLNIAYNAALQLATLALAAEGYRAARENHHYRVIQSLAETMGAESELVARFDQFRKKRNIAGYERAGMASDQEAKEMVDLAVGLKKTLLTWLDAKHPELR
ncbi:MAG: hypothetical protein V1873_07180 [Verrucomicrobiota bacterium]